MVVNDEIGDRMVELLESIEARLNRIEDLVLTMKMHVSGFEHEGSRYPSTGDRILEALEGLQTTLDSIDSNTLDV